MAVKKRGLGKGLSELGLTELLGQATGHPEAVPVGSALKEVVITRIKPGRYQPRRQMCQEHLEDLAASIRSQGVIQPIVLRPVNDGYELIAGERRWRAAQLAQLETIPAIIRDLSDQAAMAMALIENIQRQDLNAIEEALALQRLIDTFHMTHESVASAVGRSRASVSKALRLLKLTAAVQVFLEKKQIDMGHARALLSLPVDLQTETAQLMIDRALSVRQAEAFVRDLFAPAPSDVVHSPKDPALLKRQERLALRLGVKVAIRHGAHDKGQLVIHYSDHDELDGILSRIS